MTTELNTNSNDVYCPDCNKKLRKSEIESTLTEEKYICDNSDCPRKSLTIKTTIGKAAQVAPVVMAAGVVIGFLSQIFKNQDD